MAKNANMRVFYYIYFMHISSNRFRDKSDCKNFNSPEWICFTLRIVKSNHPKVFTLKLLVSLVFLGHHIVVFFIFRYCAWYDLSLFNLDLIINLSIGIGTFHNKGSGLNVSIKTSHAPLPFFLNQQRVEFVNGWKWFH